jgi:hypothetical protein
MKTRVCPKNSIVKTMEYPRVSIPEHHLRMEKTQTYP